MSEQVVMIMPMAGRGSRFFKQGITNPKPLIEIAGKPFFYWATLGVIRELPMVKLVYVVLMDHVEKFQIDRKILDYFPHATIICIDEVTSGALETAMKARSTVDPDAALIINDCDHAFMYSQLRLACHSLFNGLDGFLSHFHSDKSHFSYAKYSKDGLLIRTAEKQVISNLAIAGIYGFRNFQIFGNASERYVTNCPYSELFISGVYNEMLNLNARINGLLIDNHVPFGTPDEYQAALHRTDELQNLQR
jgi:dTDP-glucose pyrophosphorylase